MNDYFTFIRFDFVNLLSATEQQEWKRVEDPDELIDEDILKKAESQWDSSRSGLRKLLIHQKV